MAAKPTKFQAIDPDTEYEIITPGPGDMSPDAVYCCLCEGDQTLCTTEDSYGSFLSAVAAQALAYWTAR